MEGVARVIKKNERPEIKAMGDKHIIMLDGSDTDNKLSFIEQTYEPGKGSSLHSHVNDHHVFYVLRGCFKMILGTMENEVFEGDTVYIPKGVLHGFKATSTFPAKALVFTFPAGLENFFVSLSTLDAEGSGKEDIGKLALQYGICLPDK